MKRRTLLAVDLSYQVYRAAAARPGLSSAESVFTGGLFGFLATLAKTIRETEATHVIVCEDRKPYKRSLTYPQYKLLRTKTQDEKLKQQVDLSKELVLSACAVIGLPVLGVPGFESDDIIAHMTLLQRHRFDLIFAATNDSDLFRLLDQPNFRIYRKDLTDVIDRAALLTKTGLTPEQHMLASALTGTHNDIEGIHRVGPVTAARAVKDAGLLRAYRESHGALITRNLDLIKLPHSDFPKELQLPPPTRSFHHRDFYRFCGRFNITATSAMLDSFEQVAP